MTHLYQLQKLDAQKITVENFAPYGQLILPTPDGHVYDEDDAQLDLNNGIPRFYIMSLDYRGKKFHKITRHNLCTQCLGSLEGQDWFIAVAPPTVAPQPDIEAMSAFKIPGNCFIKLNVGTWHAGPFFDCEIVNFYNLELSDTNVVDHFTYNFRTQQQLEFEIVG